MFGKKLEYARFDCLSIFETGKPQRALVLGDGDGRFSYNALKLNPHLSIDSIEQSSSMREQARKRIQQLGKDDARRHAHIAYNALTYSFPISEYDIVVVQFFLDCFESSNANRLLSKLARALKANGKLAYADFSVPGRYPTKLIGKTVVSFLYLFFRMTANIESKRLPTLVWPDSLELTLKRQIMDGLVVCEIRTRT